MLMVMRGGCIVEPTKEDVEAIKKWLTMTPAERKHVERQAKQNVNKKPK